MTPFDPNDPLGRDKLANWDQQTLKNWLNQQLPDLLPNFSGQIAYATGTLRGELTSDLTNALVERPGVVKWFVTDTAPDGYLACDGTVYNIADYPDLGALLAPQSARFGGDGTTTFGVPDLRGRAPWGLGVQSDVDTIGKSDVFLVANRTPAHQHSYIHQHPMPHNHDFTTNGTVAHQNAASSTHTHSESGGGTTGGPSANVTLADSPHTHTGTTGGPSFANTDDSDPVDTDRNPVPYLTLLPIVKT